MKIENERLNYLSTLCTGTHIVPAHSRNLLQKMLPRADQLITDRLEVRVTPVVVAVRVIAVVSIVAVVTCAVVTVVVVVPIVNTTGATATT